MENFKKILVGVIVGYTLITAYNYISQIYNIYIVTNTSQTHSNIKKYDEIMASNKEKLAKYKNLAKTEDQKVCLSSIDTMIEHSYKTYYTKPMTISEHLDNYYSDDDNYSSMVYIDGINNCDISEENKSLITSAIASNMIMRDGEFLRQKSIYTKNIINNGIIYRILDLIGEPALSNITNSVSKCNEAIVIRTILNEVGDNYE